MTRILTMRNGFQREALPENVLRLCKAAQCCRLAAFLLLGARHAVPSTLQIVAAAHRLDAATKMNISISRELQGN